MHGIVSLSAQLIVGIFVLLIMKFITVPVLLCLPYISNLPHIVIALAAFILAILFFFGAIYAAILVYGGFRFGFRNIIGEILRIYKKA